MKVFKILIRRAQVKMVRAIIKDNMKDFFSEIRSKDGFLIDTTYPYMTESALTDMKAIRKRNTIYSAEYGIEPDFDKELLDQLYTCNCRSMRGQSNVGLHCSLCDSDVVKNEFPIDKFGYMYTTFKVPTTHCLQILSNIMSSGDFNNLLSGVTPYKDLYSDIENIVATYCKKDRKEKGNLIIENKETFFTNYFPVISTKLRPFEITVVGKSKEDDVREYLKKDKQQSDEVKASKANTKQGYNIQASSYNTAFTQLSVAIDSYNKAYEEHIYAYCHDLKFHIYRLINEIRIATIYIGFGSKEKIARKGISAVRFPYTSVAVLAPYPWTSELDSCSIPFESYRATFQQDIIKILKNVFKMNNREIARLTNTNSILNDSDEKLILSTFKYIEHPYIYINRQPTIDWGSILVLTIKEIRMEKVLRIHPLTLAEQRADFDGDAPFMVGLPANVREMFHKILCPKAHMMMWDKSFNNRYALPNDYQVLCTIAFDDESW